MNFVIWSCSGFSKLTYAFTDTGFAVLPFFFPFFYSLLLLIGSFLWRSFPHQHWRPAEDNCRSPALRKQVTCFWVGLGVPPSPLHSAHLSSSTTLLFSPSWPAPLQQSLRLPWGCSAAATTALWGPPSPRILLQAPVTSWARPHALRKLPAQAPPLSAPLAKPRHRPWEEPWLSDWTRKFPSLEEEEVELHGAFNIWFNNLVFEPKPSIPLIHRPFQLSVSPCWSLSKPKRKKCSDEEVIERERGWRELQSGERVLNQIMTHSWEEWHGRVYNITVEKTCVFKKWTKGGQGCRMRLWWGIGRPKKIYQESHVVRENRHLTK